MIKYIVKADIKEQLAKDYLKRHENIFYIMEKNQTTR